MKFMIIVKATPDSEAGRFPPDSDKLFASMADYHEQLSKAGVLLGGILTEYLGWPWIFFVNVPVGIAVFGATLFIAAVGFALNAYAMYLMATLSLAASYWQIMLPGGILGVIVGYATFRSPASTPVPAACDLPAPGPSRRPWPASH